MKKKKIVIITALVCCMICASCFGVTYAYLIAKDEANNTFTVGETEIEINEVYEPPQELKPGVQFTKEPTIKNTGNLPCFVRMRADFSSNAAKEFCEPLNIDTTHWEYSEADGYYYYKTLLSPGASTEPLFTTVTIKSDADPSAVENFDILIYGEAVQHTDHDGDCASDEYKTEWGKY